MSTILRANEGGERTIRAGNVFKGGGGVNKDVRFETIRKTAGPELEGIRVLTGHFPIGSVRSLPEDLAERRTLDYFAFLREPVDRTLSHYFQIRETAEQDRAEGRERSKQGAFGLEPLPEDPTLEDTIEAGYIFDNLQTRMLSGEPEPFGEVTEEMLEQAKRNLREELTVFGLTERFDESLVLARRRLGLRTIIHRSSGRVSGSRPRGEEVPKDLREQAAACNVHDLELYRYATELFDSSPELAELDFQVEVAALRAARAEGSIDLDVPAPEAYGGGADEWRMLLEARASVLRCDEELASIKAATWELAGRVGQQVALVDAKVLRIERSQEQARRNRFKQARSTASKTERGAMKRERRARRQGAEASGG